MSRPPGINDDEVFVDIANGEKLVFPSFDEEEYGVSYVRFVDERGVELVYWADAEWKEDPKGVMGAIMGAISRGCIPAMKENLVEKTEKEMKHAEVKGYGKADPEERKEGQVLARLFMSALTRMEYTQEVWVNPGTTRDELERMAEDTYDYLDDEFVEDHEYWERGHCWGEIVEEEEK